MSDEMNELEKLKIVQDSRARRALAASQGTFAGFIDFVREHGIVGLAIGFILGGAVSKVTTSFSTDIVSPIFTSFFGFEKLADITLGPINAGKFAAAILDFLILVFVVYLIFKVLGLDRLRRK